MPFPVKLILKPYLITAPVYREIQDFNLVGFDDFQEKVENSVGHASPRLLNWVEPYKWNGFNKTAFYTEVNSNIQVGDRVWIINGYYDSDLLIQNDKYKTGRDGYKVLYVDRCKIVLDIDYIGTLPYNDYDNIDDFIKVYKVSTRDEFIHASRQITTRDGNLNYKFNKYQNNIIFADSIDSNIYGPVYNEITLSYTSSIANNGLHIAGYGVNLGLTGSPGFFVKDGLGYWKNISKELFYYGSYSVAMGTYSNMRFKVMNGTFNYNGVEFRDGLSYEWFNGPTNSYWRVDKRYSKSIITKSNFRKGIFKGEFNNGVYGSQDNRIKWTNEGKFYGGTILNTEWENGILDSKINLTSNFKAVISNNQVIQKSNSDNNGGYGYNFIIDSFLKSSQVINANIIDSKIGEPVTTKKTVENHLKSITQTFNNKISKAYFNGCDFSSISIDNTTLVNSKITDSKITNSKVINSQIFDSVVKDSTYISEDSIKIRAYDEWNISEYQFTNLSNIATASSPTYSIIQLSSNIPNARTTHKLYKFYINETDYKKIKNGDYFYIKGLRFTNNSKQLVNFFERKFKIGVWSEFEDDYTTIPINTGYSYDAQSYYKRGFEYSTFLSTPRDNSFVLNSATTSVDIKYLSQDVPAVYTTLANKNVQFTKVIGTNSNSNLYSVDIIVSIQDNFNRTTDFNGFNFNYGSTVSGLTQSLFRGNFVDFSNAYILESNFESGVFETSDWNSGYNINYNNDTNISSLTGSGIYRIQKDFSTNTLIVETTQYYTPNTKETEFNVGDIIFLNSIDYVNGDYVVRIPDAYKVNSKSGTSLVLTEVNTNVIKGLTYGGYFRTNKSENRWGYISKSKFYRSKIKSGFFRRSYFNQSLIQNSNYDSTDKDFNSFSKIKNLLITDSIFSNNKNILSSATYLNSFFIGGDDIWNDGIIYNSYINGLTFSKGVVKESVWKNGQFTGGVFYNSKTFDGVSSELNQFYFDNRIKTSWRSGRLSGTISNTRYSWQNGTFLGGEFYKSDWEDGLFKNGLFYYSKFYKGTFSGGTIGTIKNSVSDTIVYNGDIKYTTVNNASLYSKDPNWAGTSYSTINWYDGIFNDGLFGSYGEEILFYTQSIATASVVDPISGNYDFTLGGGPVPNNSQYSALNYLIISLTSSETMMVEDYSNLEVFVKLDVNYSQTQHLIINLKGPSGKTINVKKSQDGPGQNFNNTKFSSNSDNLPLLQSYSPYNSDQPPYITFKMNKEIGIGNTSSYSDTNEIKDLLYNRNSISGTWSLILIDGSTLNNRAIVDSFTLDFKFDYKSNTNTLNKAIWYNGRFNGGQFIDFAKWKNGSFNGGKFISTLGWTASGNYFNNSIDVADYTWENGTFSNGEFGNGELRNNSTWYNGHFKNGEFKGRVWNYGVFSGGNFKGSSKLRASGNFNIDNYTSNASAFVDGYTYSFYGLWVNGIVTGKPNNYLTNNKIYYNPNTTNAKDAFFDNMLWLSGTFSHENGTMNNSVWLTGDFNQGKFKNGSFNPYVRRGNSSLPYVFPYKLSPSNYRFTPDFNPPIQSLEKDTSRWLNGDFIEGDFYMSKWSGGNFISGTAYGMIFLGGISKFMNAYNVIWEGGTWQNGNWFGSDFYYSGGFNNNNFIYNVVRRGMRDYGYNTTVPQWSNNPLISLTWTFNGPGQKKYEGLNKLHIWNLFESDTQTSTVITSVNAANISFDINFEDPGTYLDPTVGWESGSGATVLNPDIGNEFSSDTGVTYNGDDSRAFNRQQDIRNE